MEELFEGFGLLNSIKLIEVSSLSQVDLATVRVVTALPPPGGVLPRLIREQHLVYGFILAHRIKVLDRFPKVMSRQHFQHVLKNINIRLSNANLTLPG